MCTLTLTKHLTMEHSVCLSIYLYLPVTLYQLYVTPSALNLYSYKSGMEQSEQDGPDPD